MRGVFLVAKWWPIPIEIAFPSFAAIIWFSGEVLSVMNAHIFLSKESGTPVNKSTPDCFKE